MLITQYAKKNPTQKKDAPTAASILDTSSQSESLQRKADMANNTIQQAETPRPNNTGMPDNLKSGIESLSGFSMDDVRVHYNSSKPATVQALAYTQGTDIHVAPGQEKHLPHEAWHVAQQMAGRVSPTTNINGMPVNDNAALEHEADVMGEMALGQRKKTVELQKKNVIHKTNQRTAISYQTQSVYFYNEDRQENGTEIIGKKTTANLDAKYPAKGTEPGSDQQNLMNAIKPDGYSKNPYIKGHLLNHHLGGLGKSANMAPLTKNANALHEMFVEQGVKNLIYNGYEVDYIVTATVVGKESSKPLSKENPPKTTFTCNVKFNTNPTERHELQSVITSGPDPEVATYDDNTTQEVNNILKKDRKDKITLDPSSEDLSNKGWGTSKPITENRTGLKRGRPSETDSDTQTKKSHLTPRISETPKKEVIGGTTIANLDSKEPIKGTGAGGYQENLMKAIKPDYYTNNNPYIKGHLLNHNLGGLGIAENMAPLTSNANALHEMFVEQGVKNLIYNGYEVNYIVTATVVGKESSKPLSKENPPKTTFTCNVKFNTNPTERHELQSVITSGPDPEEAKYTINITQKVNNILKEDRKGNTTPDASSDDFSLKASSKKLTDKKWGPIKNSDEIMYSGVPSDSESNEDFIKTSQKTFILTKNRGLKKYNEYITSYPRSSIDKSELFNSKSQIALTDLQPPQKRMMTRMRKKLEEFEQLMKPIKRKIDIENDFDEHLDLERRKK